MEFLKYAPVLPMHQLELIKEYQEERSRKK